MGWWVLLADKDNPSGLSNKVQWKKFITFLFDMLTTIWHGEEKDIVILKKSIQIPLR